MVVLFIQSTDCTLTNYVQRWFPTRNRLLVSSQGCSRLFSISSLCINLQLIVLLIPSSYNYSSSSFIFCRWIPARICSHHRETVSEFPLLSSITWWFETTRICSCSSEIVFRLMESSNCMLLIYSRCSSNKLAPVMPRLSDCITVSTLYISAYT